MRGVAGELLRARPVAANHHDLRPGLVTVPEKVAEPERDPLRVR